MHSISSLRMLLSLAGRNIFQIEKKIFRETTRALKEATGTFEYKLGGRVHRDGRIWASLVKSVFFSTNTAGTLMNHQYG